jgi:hypothetical protein
MRNGHYSGDKFDMAITFYHLYIFRNKKPFGLLICIFAVLRGDTHGDHIYGHDGTGHNGQSWKMAIIAVMVRLDMAINMVIMGVSSKFSKNADQQPKRFLNIWKW